jgi:hypothetical protein
LTNVDVSFPNTPIEGRKDDSALEIELDLCEGRSRLGQRRLGHEFSALELLEICCACSTSSLELSSPSGFCGREAGFALSNFFDRPGAISRDAMFTIVETQKFVPTPEKTAHDEVLRDPQNAATHLCNQITFGSGRHHPL